MSDTTTDTPPPGARIPADIDTPDRIVYGLTARQLAILTVAALVGYSLLRLLGPVLPPLVVIAGVIPLGAAAIVLALGRRDGLPLDAWLLAAIRFRAAPRRLAPGAAPSDLPGWAPQVAEPGPAPLRLPATAISDTGVIDTGTHSVALVACGTVNIGLRTASEQSALIGCYARWLNSLTGPVQIVVSAQRVDLSGHARRVAAAAAHQPHPALGAAAADYAAFLDDLALGRDPLWRTVTVAVTAPAGDAGAAELRRRAEHTAAALATLGAQTRLLDGACATAVLTRAADPYTPADTTWGRARPGQAITAAGEWS